MAYSVDGEEATEESKERTIERRALSKKENEDFYLL